MLLSIRNKFIFIYVFIFFLSLLSISSLYYFASNDAIENILIESALNQTKLQAEKFSENAEYHAGVLADKAMQLNIDQVDHDEMRNLLGNLESSEYYIFEHVFYVDASGASYNKTGLIGDVNDSKYFTEIMTGEYNFYISNPVLGRTINAPAFHVSVPVRRDGEIKGVLVGAISLSALSKNMSDVALEYDSYGWVIDEDMTIVAHKDISFASFTKIEDLPKDKYDFIDDAIERLKTDESGVGYYYDKSASSYKGFVFTTIDYTQNWKLGITFTESDIFLRQSNLAIVVWSFAIVLFILGTIATIVMTGSVVKPIQKLTEAITKGEQLNIKINRLQMNKEIFVLIDKYNNMQTTIREHASELEMQVEERTIALNEANEKLYQLATRDKLTGIYNRMKLDELVAGLENDVNNGSINSFGLLFIDLNNFKYFNDTFGHEVGDMILINVSNHLRSSISPKDDIVRYGGDEFIILLHGVTKENIKKIMNRIIKSIDNQDSYRQQLANWNHGIKPSIPDDKRLGISIGYVVYEKGEERSVDELVKYADEHMYKMKRKKKD